MTLTLPPFYFDADADPDTAFHFDADANPDPDPDADPCEPGPQKWLKLRETEWLLAQKNAGTSRQYFIEKFKNGSKMTLGISLKARRS
jgi:hypothetical protein